MNKNNALILAIVVGIILFGAVMYDIGTNGTKNNTIAASTPLNDMGTTGPDPMHPQAGNVSSTSFNNLVNKPLPDFNLADRDGKVYSPDALRGKNAILFFTEGAMCYPACWNQIVSFAEDDRFKANDTVILSIVLDSKTDWQQTVSKAPNLAKATVLFDTGGVVSNKFGTLNAPSSMHPGSLPGHTYLLVDKKGIVRYVFDDPQMAIRNDQLITEIAKI